MTSQDAGGRPDDTNLRLYLICVEAYLARFLWRRPEEPCYLDANTGERLSLCAWPHTDLLLALSVHAENKFQRRCSSLPADSRPQCVRTAEAERTCSSCCYVDSSTASPGATGDCRRHPDRDSSPAR
jgi:hypothetical protein